MKKKYLVPLLVLALAVPVYVAVVRADEERDTNESEEQAQELERHDSEQEQETQKDAQERQREAQKQAWERDREASKKLAEQQREQLKKNTERQLRCKNIAVRLQTRVNRYANFQKAKLHVLNGMYNRLEAVYNRLADPSLNLDSAKLEKLKNDLGSTTDAVDANTLAGKINKFNADFTTFIGTITALQSSQVNCGNGITTAAVKGDSDENETEDEDKNESVESDQSDSDHEDVNENDENDNEQADEDDVSDQHVSQGLGEARKLTAVLRQDLVDIRQFFLTTIKADIQALRAQLPKDEDTSESGGPTKLQGGDEDQAEQDNEEKDTTATTTTGTTSNTDTTTQDQNND